MCSGSEVTCFRSKFAWSVAGALLVIQFSLLAQGVDFVVGWLTNDDTFYYLQTVWNARHAGFVSFDGIHSTSGVQFLWFGFLYVLSWIFTTKEALLMGSMALCFVLNSACVFPIMAIGRKLERSFLGFALALGWATVIFSKRYWLGLENSLQALLLWMIIAEMIESVQSGPRWWVLGTLWLLNVWTRIDAAVFCAAMAAVILLTEARQGGTLDRGMHRLLRGVVPLVVIMLPGGLLYAAVSWWMGGAVLPVSVIVKTAGQPEPLEGMTRLAHRLACDAAPLLPFRFESRATLVSLWCVGLVAIVATIGASFRTKSGLIARPYFIATAALGLGWLAYHAVAWIQDYHYADYCSWHRSSAFILCLLLLTSPLALFEEDASADRHKYFVWVRLGLVLAVGVFCVHRYQGTLSFPYERHIWHIRHYAARWIDRNLPKDVRLGAWNAGEVGYFSNRQVINLDGLVNDVDYARSIVIGGGSLVSYLASNRVEYLVDYLDGIPVKNDLRVEELRAVKIFDRGGGNPLSIWKLDLPETDSKDRK